MFLLLGNSDQHFKNKDKEANKYLIFPTLRRNKIVSNYLVVSHKILDHKTFFEIYKMLFYVQVKFSILYTT